MTSYALVCDVGGTNARFALVPEGATQVEQELTLQCADYSNVYEACRVYLDRVSVNSVSRACLAFACPVDQEQISMTNNHWCFTRTGLADVLGVSRLKVVNDFTAMALGMMHVPGEQLLPLNAGEFTSMPRLVIGPGTGLGVSALVPAGDGWIPLSTEGGHISFAPTSERDIKLWRILREKFGRVSVERLLCGAGLVNIYSALCEIDGKQPDLHTPKQVTDAALLGENPLAVQTLNDFCRVLGGVAGDGVLNIGAIGGVYLCGGILPRVQEFLLKSEFLKGFKDKGRFAPYVESVPVSLCVAENPGLLGAAAALNNANVKG
ncbi:MAG: glucokinase [Neptuniibacter sp.]